MREGEWEKWSKRKRNGCAIVVWFGLDAGFRFWGFRRQTNLEIMPGFYNFNESDQSVDSFAFANCHSYAPFFSIFSLR